MSGRPSIGTTYGHAQADTLAGARENPVLFWERFVAVQDNPYTFEVSSNSNMHAEFQVKRAEKNDITFTGCRIKSQWFPIASSAVAQVKHMKPETSNSLDRLGAFFHSPVITPDRIAVMIMNI
jgi:hypothetical protein